MKTAVIIIFLLVYVALLVLPKWRALIALVGGALMLSIGAIPLENVMQYLDFNVLLMLFGTMGLVYYFIESKMPAFLAERIAQKTKTVRATVVALSAFAGIISAFVDNVATVLMVAPIALDICRKLKISPVLPIIAIAISSNLQGAATLVGDTTSIIVGSNLGLTFADFFVNDGRIGMFFITELAAVFATVVLFFFFRKQKDVIEIECETKVTDFTSTVMLLVMLALLITASFIPEKPAITSGLICTICFIVVAIISLIKEKNFKPLLNGLKEVDYNTLGVLIGIFLLVGGLTETGIVNDIGNFFLSISGDSLILAYTLIVFGSVIISAFIDNIPYVTAMIPVVATITLGLGVQTNILFYALLVGATLGGNLTPIGASANVAALGILRKEGCTVKNGEFMKVSVPFTLTAVLSGYLILFLCWGL